MKFSYGATPRGHYTPAVISKGMVYVSGQTSLDPATGLSAAGGVEAEAMFALKKLDPILAAAGCGKENIVMCRVYIVSNDDWEPVNRAYAEYFGDHKPARVTIPIKELNKGCRVEIEVTAELPE